MEKKVRWKKKNRWMQKALVLFTLAMVILFPQKILASDAGTREDAVKWAYAQEGKKLDYDGKYGAQCVDLIKYYYAYFGQASYAKGNGSDYTSNTLPHGWISIPKTDGFVPEPGDIAVWGTELSANGHVAIVLSANANSFVSMDQNWPSGSACKQVKHTYTKFWGVIRPNFTDQKDTPADVGDNFYAYLINTATWLHATNDDSGNVSVRNLKYTSDQIWHFEKQGDGSYKITSCKDGRCMEVHNFESANGTNVEMNNWSGNTAQKWFVYGDSGAYKLKAACGDNALDMSGGSEAAQDGTNLNMWEENGSDAQKFSIWKLNFPDLGTTAASVENYGDSDGNNVKISWNACKDATGYDIRIFDANGANVVQTFWNVQGTSCLAKLDGGTYRIKVYTLNSQFNTWKEGEARSFTCSNNLGNDFYAYLINTATWLHATNDAGNVNVKTLDYSPAQIWHFTLQSHGSYKITSAEDDRCMEVHNFETANGTNVEMNSWNGNTAQKWFIYGSSGAFKLKAACGNPVLDMRGGSESAQSGTNLNMWEDNGSDAQKFSIWKLDQIKDTIRNATVTLEYTSCTYDGKEHTPVVTIKKGAAELKTDTDYKITYADNKNAGTAAITVTGIGAYTGKITREFQIKKADQELKISVKKTEISVGESAQLTVTGQGNMTYRISPENIINISDTGMIRGKQAGKAVITVRAEGNENYNSAEKNITIQVKKSGWQKEEKGWRYYQQTGETVKSSWKYINKTWYHFNANGYMQTGWLKLQGTWYYLKADGAMIANQWRKINEKWYHFDASGSMQNGWLKLGETWYYLKADGAMAADEWVDNGKSYVNENGKYVPGKVKYTEGWKKNSKGWWYQNKDGSYPTNQWKKLNGKWYHFDASGYMQTGWLKLGDIWYYLKTDGAMAADEWVDNGKYYVDINGRWT